MCESTLRGWRKTVLIWSCRRVGPLTDHCKGKVDPRTGHEAPEREQRYSSTLSLTSALDGVGRQHHALAALPPGKIRYPLYRRLGGPQGRSGQARKISPPLGFDPRTIQPVASRYTGWTTGPTLNFMLLSIIIFLRHVWFVLFDHHQREGKSAKRKSVLSEGPPHSSQSTQ